MNVFDKQTAENKKVQKLICDFWVEYACSYICGERRFLVAAQLLGIGEVSGAVTCLCHAFLLSLPRDNGS
jgi:hypothetical protein